MKIKAIIAHRNELPANLHRTYYHIKSHGVDVELIEDVKRKGCGYMRHKAIMATDADAVLICDAHMKFSAGYFESVVDHLIKNPNDITVSRMQSIDYDWDDLQGELYAGAYIKLFDAWSGNYFPISAKWRRKETGKKHIGAVMGACYGMTVSNYRRMGKPLAILRAWGGDEEALSIACNMTGGNVSIIEGTAYHMFAAPRINLKPMTETETANYWANRLALVYAVPMQEKLKCKLLSHFYRSSYPLNNMHLINQCLDQRKNEIEQMHDTITKVKKVNFVDYVNKYAEDEDPRQEAEYMAKRQKADKQRAKRTYTQAPRVVDEGVKCPHCCHCYDHRITNTYDNGNRRRVCGSCGKPFITCRK